MSMARSSLEAEWLLARSRLRDDALDKIRVRRQVMPRVCRTRSSLATIQVQAALVHDTAEDIAPNAVFLRKAATVHAPQIISADSRVFLPDLTHILHNKLLHCQTVEQRLVIILVKGLSCHTGQCTETRYCISFFAVQPFDSSFYLLFHAVRPFACKDT